MKIFAIILINGYDEIKIKADEIRLHKCGFRGCRILIPTVRTLKHVIYHKETYEYKPLLFRYGFMELPIDYTYSFDILQNLKGLSTSILGFMMRRKNDLVQERLKNSLLEENIGKSIPQVLTENLPIEEITRLFEAAKALSVYDNVYDLAIGSFVILRGYPFENLGAEIIAKYGSTVKVRLLSTGYTVQVQLDNLYYSPYQEEKPHYKEVCFTELGYIPDV